MQAGVGGLNILRTFPKMPVLDLCWINAVGFGNSCVTNLCLQVVQLSPVDNKIRILGTSCLS